MAIKLTSNEWTILNNNIEYDEARSKAASVLLYLKKHINLNGGSWSKSFKDIHTMYKRYHKQFTLTHFKNIVNRLRDLELISITVIKKRNVYSLPINPIVTEKVTETNQALPVENKGIEEVSKKPRFMDDNNIDIDSYSNSKEFDSCSYEKCSSLVDVRLRAKELLKQFRVKSDWLKNKVLVAVTKHYKNITIKFLDNYIIKTISSARNEYYNNWNKAKANKVNNANFTQREDYNWSELESQLLSHY